MDGWGNAEPGVLEPNMERGRHPFRRVALLSWRGTRLALRRSSIRATACERLGVLSGEAGAVRHFCQWAPLMRAPMALMLSAAGRATTHGGATPAVAQDRQKRCCLCCCQAPHRCTVVCVPGHHSVPLGVGLRAGRAATRPANLHKQPRPPRPPRLFPLLQVSTSRQVLEPRQRTA